MVVQKGTNKKLLEVVSEGPHATEVRRTPTIKHCINCANELLSVTLGEVCQCGDYCSRQCLMNHVNHKQYCAAIFSLEKLETEKRMKKGIRVSDSEKLPIKMKMKLIRLVGERPLVNVFLNNSEVEGLWDD